MTWGSARRPNFLLCKSVCSGPILRCSISYESCNADRCPFLLDIRPHVAHYVKYTFSKLWILLAASLLYTPASFPLVLSLTTVMPEYSKILCLITWPVMAFICLHGFSKEPCLFCQPGLFCFTLVSLMGRCVSICPFKTALATANWGFYANCFGTLMANC